MEGHQHHRPGDSTSGPIDLSQMQPDLASSSQSNSKKRKEAPSASASANNNHPSHLSESSSSAHAAAEADKRIKTARACDSCRRKKIRCEPLDEAAAESSAVAPKCRYCAGKKLECTWYLPIGETRWASKGGKPPTQAERRSFPSGTSGGSDSPDLVHRQLQTRRSAAVTSDTAALPPTSRAPPSLGYSSSSHLPNGSLASSSSPAPSLSLPHASNSGVRTATSAAATLPQRSPADAPRANTSSETRFMGPTSILHMVHDAADTDGAQPAYIKGFARKNEFHWKIDASSAAPDGLVRLVPSPGEGTSEGEPRAMTDTSITPETLEQLVNVYLTSCSLIFPILSRTDFLSAQPLEPLLLWTIVSIAASSHKVPAGVFRSARHNLAVAARETDVMAHTDLQIVQAHLLFSMHMDLENVQAGTKAWTSTGLAIRAAQNMGLHRENDSDDEACMHQSELRRRVWGGCIIADRWISALYGLPMMIDLTDCDRLYPAEQEYLPGQRLEDVDLNVKPFLGNAAMIELSVLLGDVLKLIYSPSGLAGVTDEQLFEVKNALNRWIRELPSELHFTDTRSSPPMAGFLVMCYATVMFLFYRPFMNPANNLARHGIHFCVTNADFAYILNLSSVVISWINTCDYILESWAIALYGLFTCALIQYHQFVRHRDLSALKTLRLAAQIMKRIQSGDCLTRAKTSEIVNILEHTATSLQSTSAPPPTAAPLAETPPTPPPAPTRSEAFMPAPPHAMASSWPSHAPVPSHHLPTPPPPAPMPNYSLPATWSTGYPEQPVYQSNSIEGFPGGDPQSPFTFIPGADFAGPGPTGGPLSFDPGLPSSLISDPNHWHALMEGLEAATRPDGM